MSCTTNHISQTAIRFPKTANIICAANFQFQFLLLAMKIYSYIFYLLSQARQRSPSFFFKLKGDLKATTLSENSVWYSIISRRLWVLMWRKSTCAKADFQSLGLHPWSALSSLSMNGTKQCRIASVVSLEALRKCRQIPSVLSSFYLIRISDTLPCCLQTL